MDPYGSTWIHIWMHIWIYMDPYGLWIQLDPAGGGSAVHEWRSCMGRAGQEKEGRRLKEQERQDEARIRRELRQLQASFEREQSPPSRSHGSTAHQPHEVDFLYQTF